MNKTPVARHWRNPAFRRLWIATVTFGTCVAAHESALIRMKPIFMGSTFFIFLTSTVASLEFGLYSFLCLPRRFFGPGVI